MNLSQKKASTFPSAQPASYAELRRQMASIVGTLSEEELFRLARKLKLRVLVSGRWDSREIAFGKTFKSKAAALAAFERDSAPTRELDLAFARIWEATAPDSFDSAALGLLTPQAPGSVQGLAAQRLANRDGNAAARTLVEAFAAGYSGADQGMSVLPASLVIAEVARCMRARLNQRHPRIHFALIRMMARHPRAVDAPLLVEWGRRCPTDRDFVLEALLAIGTRAALQGGATFLDDKSLDVRSSARRCFLFLDRKTAFSRLRRILTDQVLDDPTQMDEESPGGEWLMALHTDAFDYVHNQPHPRPIIDAPPWEKFFLQQLARGSTLFDEHLAILAEVRHRPVHRELLVALVDRLSQPNQDFFETTHRLWQHREDPRLKGLLQAQLSRETNSKQAAKIRKWALSERILPDEKLTSEAMADRIQALAGALPAFKPHKSVRPVLEDLRWLDLSAGTIEDYEKRFGSLGWEAVGDRYQVGFRKPRPGHTIYLAHDDDKVHGAVLWVDGWEMKSLSDFRSEAHFEKFRAKCEVHYQGFLNLCRDVLGRPLHSVQLPVSQ